MRRIRAAGLVFALALSVVSGHLGAQAAAPAAQQPAIALSQQLPVDAAVRTGQLANGMRYYIRRNTLPANRVSMRLAVNVGSLMEENDQRGLAHFVEHMAFNGSESFKPGELISFLESIGARFGPHVNAYTSFDETVYMLDVPTDKPGYVDKGMTALHDFATGATLLAEEVEKERGVVIEEWRGRLGAGSRLMEKQLPVIFAGSRYAERLPIGTPEVLKSFPRQRLVDFYRKWYRPDQMAIIVVGDIDPAEAQKLIEQHFSRIPAVKTPVQAIDRGVPPNKETKYSVATDPEAQGWSVSLAFKRPTEIDTTVADYRRSLVQQLVTQMLNLRLREIARRPNAPFLAANAGGSSLGRSVDLFELEATVQEGRLTQGLEALVTEARRMQKFGFSKDELERAKAVTLSFYERAYKERNTSESPQYASEYVRAFLEQEAIPGIEFEYKIALTFVPGITLEEVTAEATKLVRDENRLVLAVAPEKQGVAVATEQQLQAALTKGEGAPVETWTDALAGRDLVENPPAPGKVTARRTIPELDATILTLSNGVEVWLKPTTFKSDQVLFSSYALGGVSLASQQDFQEATLATSLVGMGGMGGLSPVDLSKLVAGKIASAAPSVGEYTQGTSGSASPRDLETALKLNYLAFTAPNLTRDAFELMKRRYISALENQAQNPRFVFSEKVAQVNTSNHYSAKAPTPADILALDLDAMSRFYKERFSNAADFTFLFVGNFTVDEMVPLLEKWVATLPSTGKKTAKFRDMGIRFPSSVVKEEVKKGKEPASQTVMSFFADTNLEELEMHRARAAASLLGIRLRDILREELGGTYSVGVSYDNPLPTKGYGAMRVQFGSAPENVQKLTDAVLKEVERLKKEGPNAEDVAKVKELERRDLEEATKQNAYWLGSMQTVHMLGWDPIGITRRDQRIEKLTAPVLQDMFKKYFPIERYTVVTLKPETTTAQ